MTYGGWLGEGAVRLLQTRWFQILGGGTVLFFFAVQAVAGGNAVYLTAVLLLGAFTVPAAFVAYVVSYERSVDRERHGGIPFGSIFVSFVVGGILGVTAAGLIEFQTLRALGPLQMLGVGLIEEPVKLVIPIFYFIRGTYRSEADGILFGVASGMGFAAFETIGYGLSAYLSSGGDVGAVAGVLTVRAFFSPAGHAVWTGYVCGVLWRERDCKGRFVLSPPIVGAFFLAVILHASWNIIGSSEIAAGLMIPGLIFIAALSVTLLVRRFQEARRRECP